MLPLSDFYMRYKGNPKIAAYPTSYCRACTKLESIDTFKRLKERTPDAGATA